MSLYKEYLKKQGEHEQDKKEYEKIIYDTQKDFCDEFLSSKLINKGEAHFNVKNKDICFYRYSSYETHGGDVYTCVPFHIFEEVLQDEKYKGVKINRERKYLSSDKIKVSWN